MRRSIVTLATALAALTAVACEPPPPPAMFTVNSHDPAGDANPGDGVCETAPGNGVCTITAAVEEGNALGKAVIDFPVHTDPTPEPPLAVATITGDITLRSGFTVQNPTASAIATTLTVEPGAVLRLEGFTLLVWEGLTVEGALLIDRSGLVATTTITEGGSLFALNSFLLDAAEIPPGEAMIMNAGTLVMRFSDVSTTQPMLHTAPGATSIIGASSLFGAEAGACTGEPVTSEGYNIDFTGVDVGDGVWVDRCTDDPSPQTINVHDAVPYGVLGCGTTVTVDNLGNPRPVDDDDDGIALCGVGPLESGWY